MFTVNKINYQQINIDISGKLDADDIKKALINL